MNNKELLLKFIDENPDSIDKFLKLLNIKPPEMVPWDASMGKHYYLTNGLGPWLSLGPQPNILMQPFCYKTKTDAVQMLQFLFVMYKLRMQTKGFVPNWDAEYEIAYSILFNVKNHKWNILKHIQDTGSVVYFKTYEDAKLAANSLTQDEINTFINGWPVIPMVIKE